VELAWLLTGLAVGIGLAANAYAGWLPLPTWLYYLVFYGSVLSLFFGLRYRLRSLGLAWASKRAWLAGLVVIMINIGAAALFQLLPAGERVIPPQADLANQITGPWSVLVLIVGLIFRAALPEELMLRIGLQPRLAQFMPLGWAILVQACLFSAGHLPQHLIRNQEPLLLALGYLMAIDNGLLGGYFWYRTRSLPLLIVLHLFAYPRFGI